jgi:TonB-linked SusC/RagA family outer membrane protein
MNMKHFNLTKLIIGILLLTNLFGLPAIASSKGQPSDKSSEFEKIVESIETKYKVSITVDADAMNKEKDAKEKIENNSEKILESENIEGALDLLVEGTDLEYQKLRNDFYIIKLKKEKPQSSPEKKNDFQQESVTIKGQVTQKTDGTTLPGVNVFVKGTIIGASTDIDGNYEISVPESATTIVFSFLGFKTVEVPIDGQTTINVQLADDVFGLDEVIIAGVASATPRKNLSVSISRVDAKVLKEVPAYSAAGALQGKVAGVDIVHANGQPGSGASIRIRGSTSLTGDQKPMVMLDGNILYTNLADINTEDIESIEVVKGAAAAALYGSQAGNGVIVINTKRGKGRPGESSSIIFRQAVGTQQLAKQIELSDHHPYRLADDWQEYPYTRYEGIWYNDEGYPISGNRTLANGDSSYANQPYSKIINQQDEFFTQGLYNTTYLSFLGNSEKSNFMISYERNHQEGIILETNGYTRNNLKLNLDHVVSKRIKISTSNLFLTTNSDNPGSNATFNDLLFIGPDVDLTQKNPDGSDYLIKPDPWSIAENPLYPLKYRERTSKQMSFIGNVRAFLDIVEGLTFNVKYTYEYRNKQWDTYTPKGYLADYPSYYLGSLYKEAYYEFDQSFQATLHYNKQIKDFTTKAKLSYLYENSDYNDFWVTGREFSVSDVPQLDWTDPTKAALGSYEGQIVSISYIGIVDLDYKDKYLFSMQYRVDGSSLFGEESRWHPFYRISGGYRFTQDFTIPGIQELKVRAAYGGSGQRPGFNNQYEVWGGSGGYIVPGTMGNKNLQPSITREFEAGLDMEFLDMFYFEFIYADANTDGAIRLAPVPSQTGYSQQWQNVGDINSKVIEVTLGAKLFQNRKFTWDANLVFDRVRQTITNLNVPPYNTGPKNAFYFREGETFALLYGYQWLTSLDEMAMQLPEGQTIDDYIINSDGYVIPAGTEGTNAEIPIELDQDNDGLGDKVQIGNGNPKFNLSMTNTFNYKNFTLYFLLSWKNGGDVYNYTRQYTFRDLRAAEFDQYGKAPEEMKTIDYYSAFYKNTEINSYFVENGAFLKLREASLYYTFNRAQMSTILGGVVKTIKIGIQARNIFTLTNYSGYDPEVATGSDLTNYPFDDFGYPNFRTFSGSIQFTF